MAVLIYGISQIRFRTLTGLLYVLIDPYLSFAFTLQTFLEVAFSTSGVQALFIFHFIMWRLDTQLRKFGYATATCTLFTLPFMSLASSCLSLSPMPLTSLRQLLQPWSKMRQSGLKYPLGRAVFELFSKFITPGCSKCAIGGTDHVGIFKKKIWSTSSGSASTLKFSRQK